jgi:Ca-activated chloride channel family protein
MRLAVSLVAASVAAQTLMTPPRLQNSFDVMLKPGGVVDLNTMDELDRERHSHLDTKTEATVSQLDLKAPGNARAEYNKGLRLLTKNDFEGAIARFTKAISIYPNFVVAHNALGCAYFSVKKYDLAREQFTRSIQLDDHLSSSYLNLGRTELALGKISAAQGPLEKASAIAPLDANLMVSLAYVQYLNHDYSATIRTAQQAHSRSHPDAALVHYFSAAAWQAQNHLEETQSELQTFLTEDPKSAFAEQVRKIIEEINARQEAPSTGSVEPAFSADTTDSSASSLRGQKALQDLREKHQIAEAEAEGSECSTCNPADSRSVENPASETKELHRDHAGGWTLRSNVEEVALFFTATDQGRSVTDLTQKDVVVLDDQKPPAAMLGFRSESELPLRLGLLIDTSVSITDRFSFEQKAAANFLRQVLSGKDDLAFVAGFSYSVALVQDFTGDLNQISHGINQLVPVGGTALWDAVSFAADKLAEAKEGRPVARVLVVISDGDDNSSSATLKQAIERAERDEVVVYSVSTRNVNPEDDNALPGNRAMKVLANLTGGAAFFPGSPDHLNHSLAELQQVIHSRYFVSYKPALFRHDGRYRTITIAAKKSGRKLKVNSRKGYYTTPSTTSAADF